MRKNVLVLLFILSIKLSIYDEQVFTTSAEFKIPFYGTPVVSENLGFR